MFRNITIIFAAPNAIGALVIAWSAYLIQILFAELADLIADVQRQINDWRRLQARAPTYIK